MPINTKARDNFELYDKILVKIVDSTKVAPISFEKLYNSLFSVEALNVGMKNFKFEDIIIEDKNQPHKNGMLFILQYFKTLGLVNYDNNFNNIYATPLGIIKSHESFVQEYESKETKEDLENSLLSNQIQTNKKITCLTIILVVIGLFSVVYYIFDVLNMLGYLNTCKALK